jgi:hypothetical protein
MAILAWIGALILFAIGCYVGYLVLKAIQRGFRKLEDWESPRLYKKALDRQAREAAYKKKAAQMWLKENGQNK